MFPLSSALTSKVNEVEQLRQYLMRIDKELFLSLMGEGKTLNMPITTPSIEHLFKTHPGYFWAALTTLDRHLVNKFLDVTGGAVTAASATTFFRTVTPPEQETLIRAVSEMLAPQIGPHSNVSQPDKKLDANQKKCRVAMVKMWLLFFEKGVYPLLARKPKDALHLDCTCNHKLDMRRLRQKGTNLKTGPWTIQIDIQKNSRVILDVEHDKALFHDGTCPIRQHRSYGRFYRLFPLRQKR